MKFLVSVYHGVGKEVELGIVDAESMDAAVEKLNLSGDGSEADLWMVPPTSTLVRLREIPEINSAADVLVAVDAVDGLDELDEDDQQEGGIDDLEMDHCAQHPGREYRGK